MIANVRGLTTLPMTSPKANHNLNKGVKNDGLNLASKKQKVAKKENTTEKNGRDPKKNMVINVKIKARRIPNLKFSICSPFIFIKFISNLFKDLFKISVQLMLSEADVLIKKLFI